MEREEPGRYTERSEIEKQIPPAQAAQERTLSVGMTIFAIMSQR